MDFLAWMLEPAAQRMAADLHYAPLPVPVIELVQQRIGRKATLPVTSRYKAVTTPEARRW